MNVDFKENHLICSLSCALVLVDYHTKPRVSRCRISYFTDTYLFRRSHLRQLTHNIRFSSCNRVFHSYTDADLSSWLLRVYLYACCVPAFNFVKSKSINLFCCKLQFYRNFLPCFHHFLRRTIVHIITPTIKIH